MPCQLIRVKGRKSLGAAKFHVAKVPEYLVCPVGLKKSEM